MQYIKGYHVTIGSRLEDKSKVLLIFPVEKHDGKQDGRHTPARRSGEIFPTRTAKVVSVNSYYKFYIKQSAIVDYTVQYSI